MTRTCTKFHHPQKKKKNYPQISLSFSLTYIPLCLSCIEDTIACASVFFVREREREREGKGGREK